MVTIKVNYYDRETEIAITQTKSGLPTEDASKIVDIVRTVREEVDTSKPPTVRACIMIGRILHQRQGNIKPDDQVLIETCLDVLGFDPNSDGKIPRIIETVLAPKAHAAD